MTREEMTKLRRLQWELAEQAAPFRVASAALKKILDSCKVEVDSIKSDSENPPAWSNL